MKNQLKINKFDDKFKYKYSTYASSLKVKIPKIKIKPEYMNKTGVLILYFKSKKKKKF